jgi:hypothetical protein
MNLHEAIPKAIVAIGSALVLFAPFSRKYRDASLWLRSASFVGSLFLLAWSILGFFLLFHAKGEHTDLSWPRFWMLSHLKSDLGGIGAGILVALVTSPEFRRRSARRSKASNQSLEPTAGHCDDQI